MNILVLGDCASSGNNTLLPSILQTNDLTVKYSMSWKGDNWKKLMLWYLKETKNNRNQILDQNNIYFNATKYLEEQELANSYFKYISHNHHLTNVSKNGVTAYSYYRRLQKYEIKFNHKPDIIFVTDYYPKHNWQRINHNNSKYFLEKRFDPMNDNFVVNKQLKAPEYIQKLAYAKAKKYFLKGSNFMLKRNQKIMTWFLNYLESNNYKYYKIKFYRGFKEFDNDPSVVDCSSIADQYTTGGQDIVSEKIKASKWIADKIVQQHPWLTDNQ